MSDQHGEDGEAVLTTRSAARVDGGDLSDDQVAELLAAGRAGDEGALGDLMSSYWGRVRRFAVVNSCTDPDDFASGVVLDVLRRFRSFRGSDKRALDGYVFRVARNRLVDGHRRSRRCREAQARAGERAGDDVGPRFEDQVVGDDHVGNLLGYLTGEQREVIHLRYVEDRSVGQTAAILGKNPNTVRGLEKRAVTALRLLLVAAVAALVALGVSQYRSRQTVSISPDPIDRPAPGPTDGRGDGESGATSLPPPSAFHLDGGPSGGIGPVDGAEARPGAGGSTSGGVGGPASVTAPTASTVAPTTTVGPTSSIPMTRPPSTHVPQTRPPDSTSSTTSPPPAPVPTSSTPTATSSPPTPPSSPLTSSPLPSSSSTTASPSTAAG